MIRLIFFMFVLRLFFIFSNSSLEPSILINPQLASPIIIQPNNINCLLVMRFRLFVLAFVTAVNLGVIKCTFVQLFVIDLLDFLRN